MKKRMSVVLSMALVMGIMGQCAIAVNAASKTDDDTLNITLINQGSGQPYIAAYKNCFEKAEKDLNIKVNLVDGGWDANQQANAIQNAISSGADGIVISPVDPSAVCTYVDEALDAGIEVCALTTQIGTGDAEDPVYLASKLSAFYERAGMMQNLNGTEGSVSIIGAVSPQGGDFSEPVTQNTKRFVRCFWGLDKALAYARHFPAIHWLTSYSEYLEDLTPWYRDHVSPKFVADRNQLMAILNQESSLMEIVKLIGSDVLPDDQKLTLEIARVIRLGFLQQNAFHQEDTCVPMEKQFEMMEIILYLYEKSKALINRGMPVSVLKEDNIFERIISIKYDVPNNQLDKFEQYRKDIDAFYDKVLEKNG